MNSYYITFLCNKYKCYKINNIVDNDIINDKNNLIIFIITYCIPDKSLIYTLSYSYFGNNK